MDFKKINFWRKAVWDKLVDFPQDTRKSFEKLLRNSTFLEVGALGTIFTYSDNGTTWTYS